MSLSSAIGTLRKAAGKGEHRAMHIEAIESVASHLSVLLKMDHIPSLSAQKLTNLLRKPMIPLYESLPYEALGLSAALLRTIFINKVSPALECDRTAARRAWEGVLASLTAGVLDFLEANPNRDTKQAAASAFYPTVLDIFLPPSISPVIIDTSASLLSSVFIILSETVNGHRENQRKLRDPLILGGQRIGRALSCMKDFIAIESLLDLFALLLPNDSSASATAGARSQFIRDVFASVSSQQTTCEELVNLVELATTSDWEQLSNQIVNVLARSDVSFPQPFQIDKIETCGQVFAQTRLLVDRKGFLANIEAGEAYETYQTLYTQIEAIKFLSSSSAPGKAHVALTLSSPPVVGESMLSRPSSGRSICMSFNIRQEDRKRLTETLRNRGLGSLISHLDNKLSLTSAVPLDFGEGAGDIFSTTEEKVKTVRGIFDAATGNSSDPPRHVEFGSLHSPDALPASSPAIVAIRHPSIILDSQSIPLFEQPSKVMLKRNMSIATTEENLISLPTRSRAKQFLDSDDEEAIVQAQHKSKPRSKKPQVKKGHKNKDAKVIGLPDRDLLSDTMKPSIQVGMAEGAANEHVATLSHAVTLGSDVHLVADGTSTTLTSKSKATSTKNARPRRARSLVPATQIRPHISVDSAALFARKETVAIDVLKSPKTQEVRSSKDYVIASSVYDDIPDDIPTSEALSKVNIEVKHKQKSADNDALVGLIVHQTRGAAKRKRDLVAEPTLDEETPSQHPEKRLRKDALVIPGPASARASSPLGSPIRRATRAAKKYGKKGRTSSSVRSGLDDKATARRSDLTSDASYDNSIREAAKHVSTKGLASAMKSKTKKSTTDPVSKAKPDKRVTISSLSANDKVTESFKFPQSAREVREVPKKARVAKSKTAAAESKPQLTSTDLFAVKEKKPTPTKEFLPSTCRYSPELPQLSTENVAHVAVFARSTPFRDEAVTNVETQHRNKPTSDVGKPAITIDLTQEIPLQNEDVLHDSHLSSHQPGHQNPTVFSTAPPGALSIPVPDIPRLPQLSSLKFNHFVHSTAVVSPKKKGPISMNTGVKSNGSDNRHDKYNNAQGHDNIYRKNENEEEGSMQGVIHVLNEIQKVVIQRLKNGFDDVERDVHIGRDSLLQGAASDIHDMRAESVAHFNVLVDLEKDYATSRRTIVDGFEDLRTINQELSQYFTRIIQDHDRNCLSRKMPASLFPPMPTRLLNPTYVFD